MGNTLETKDIYLVSIIQSETVGYTHHRFEILFTNKNSLLIKIPTGCYIQGNYVNIRDENYCSIFSKSFIESEDAVKKYINSIQFKNSLKEITEIHDFVMLHWNADKVDIPTIGSKIKNSKSYINKAQ
jgi:hypothetical protein